MLIFVKYRQIVENQSLHAGRQHCSLTIVPMREAAAERKEHKKPAGSRGHNDPARRIGWKQQRGGEWLLLERQFGRAGRSAGPVHDRKQGDGARRRRKIRNQQVHRSQGHRPASPAVQPGAVPPGTGDSGRQQGAAAHPGRHRHPAEVPRGIAKVPEASASGTFPTDVTAGCRGFSPSVPG